MTWFPYLPCHGLASYSDFSLSLEIFLTPCLLPDADIWLSHQVLSPFVFLTLTLSTAGF